jgi:hypothetical protein
MDSEKQKRLEKAGWTVGTSAEFLGLSAEEQQAAEAKSDAERECAMGFLNVLVTDDLMVRMTSENGDSLLRKCVTGL